jgi:DNA recombination protein RmuC
MSITWLAALLGFLVGLIVGVLLFWRSRAAMRNEAERLRIELAETTAFLSAEQEKTAWTEDARTELQMTFKALAAEELSAKSMELKASARDELGTVVGPLQTELGKLDKHIRELESKREGAYAQIGTQLQMLHALQDSLKEQTTTLAQALRSPTVRGRWGEVQLRRLVELAGMADHVDFDEQATGESGRPDMIVRLSQGGILPVDSKVSLGAFLDAMETDDEKKRQDCLAAHAKAMRARVRELSQKAYWSQFEKSPEIVVMFVPIEASLGAAFLTDPKLFEDAIENKVLVSSPVVLFALLKSIAYGWQQQQLAENAAAIAAQGKILYNRVAGFVGHLGGVGKSLEAAVKRYNDAAGSFEARLLPAARRLREMGVGTDEIDAPKRVEVSSRIPVGVDDEDD